mgnify:CR=1 FL=1
MSGPTFSTGSPNDSPPGALQSALARAYWRAFLHRPEPSDGYRRAKEPVMVLDWNTIHEQVERWVQSQNGGISYAAVMGKVEEAVEAQIRQQTRR